MLPAREGIVNGAIGIAGAYCKILPAAVPAQTVLVPAASAVIGDPGLK